MSPGTLFTTGARKHGGALSLPRHLADRNEARVSKMKNEIKMLGRAATAGESGAASAPPCLRGESARGMNRWRVYAAVVVLCTASALPAQPAATAPADDGTRPEKVQTARKSLLEWYLAGGLFMHPIAVCSFLALAITIERLVSLRAGRVAPAGFMPGLKSRMRNLHADAPAGLAYCREHDSPVARAVAAGIRKSARGPEAVEKAIEDAGALEAVRLRTNMRFLSALANVATLLGLIGTIQGMIMAFQVAEVTGTGKFGPLAAGIYTALITTFAGLLVAIPVTIVYFYFAGKIDRLVARMNEAINEFADTYLAAPAVVPAPDRSNGMGREREPLTAVAG